MIIKSKIGDYTVNLEDDFSFVKELINSENAFFVIDKKVYEIYKEKLFHQIDQSKLKVIEALESNKTIETALDICEVMTSIPAKRNAHLISFGGGIIQDITGFAANILYRGIHWTFVPTTLLAACDSCIGGKTSLNYKKYKNLLGTFFPPEKIYICSEFFKTLSEPDFLSGLGEVVKFNIMSGYDGLERIEKDIDKLISRDQSALNQYLSTSLEFKKPFIEEDEFDKGIRIHLNFAHTFGHAFETSSDYRIPHGTAVAMGMIVANRISLQRGYLDENLVLRSEQVLKQIIHVDIDQSEMGIDNIIDAIKKDKKQTSTALTAVLLYEDMKIAIYRDLKKEEIEYAIRCLYECLANGK